MLICFNCTIETKLALDQMIAGGSYRDYSEAISASVANQALMEKEVRNNGTIVIGDSSRHVQGTIATPQPIAPVPAPILPVAQAKPKLPPARKEKASKTATHNDTIASSSSVVLGTVPVLFGLAEFPHEQPAGLADLPADMWAPGQVVPLDRWVLGQHNRLLPAKANSRAIVRLFLESQNGLPISKTAEQIAAEAAALGDYLTALDAQREAARDDCLATAFPSTAEDADKGRARYANQFVVYQNGRGELSGLMVDLKLINVVRVRKERYIVPTRVAWEFGHLANPVLDGQLQKLGSKFSDDERAMLLSHIFSSVPVEAFAYRAVLEAIQAGKNTPETIDATLKKYVTEDRAEKLSQSFLASQRSGAVSRMSDLGLVERQREGIRVAYMATNEGRAFLSRFGVSSK